jgi:hypothetical protein
MWIQFQVDKMTGTNLLVMKKKNAHQRSTRLWCGRKQSMQSSRIKVMIVLDASKTATSIQKVLLNKQQDSVESREDVGFTSSHMTVLVVSLSSIHFCVSGMVDGKESFFYKTRQNKILFCSVSLSFSLARLSHTCMSFE